MSRAVVALTSVLLVAFAQSVLAQSALETALQATVTIEVTGPDGLSHGSGFITSSDGMIITAAHVIEGATSAVVRLQNGEELNVEGVVTIDGDKDFAIVRVAGFDLPTVPLGNADDVSVGQRVIVIGAPIDAALAGTISDGLVAAFRLMDGTRIIQISAPTSPGNSGGPVLTEEGQVIGLVVSGINVDGAENLNFALPINYVRGQLALASTRTLRPLAEVRVTANGGDAPVSTLGLATASNEYEELVLSYLEARYADIRDRAREDGGDVQLIHSSLGDLDQSDRETVFLTLPEAEVFILAAVCDDDCADVDLSLLDSAGNILDEDIDLGDIPMMVIAGSQATDPVQVEVSMATCSVEPCYYALGVGVAMRLQSGLGTDSSPREIAEQDPGSGATATGQTLEVLRSRAEQGDGYSQYLLGMVYAFGNGVPKDDAEAFRLFRLAAEQGLDSAQYNLAVMYRDGMGVPVDDAEAARLFRLAADRGFAPAQNNLAVMYRDGMGVPVDDAEAVRLFRLAADQGYAYAQYELGGRYAVGVGVPQDDAEAVRWYRLAADQGDASAQYELGYRYANGIGVPQDDAEAVRWYRLAADQGGASAQYALGAMYGSGGGVPQDDAEAVRWIRLAADQGYALAQYALGMLYASGEDGVPKDDTEAVHWYQLAAEQGFADAQANLGFMYANGLGVTQDAVEALRWVRLAADQGHAYAQYSLGVVYASGEGAVLEDDTEAVRWYRLAAEQGSVYAQYSLGVVYANGEGVPEDDVLAYMWYNLAAAQGFEDSQARRDVIGRQMTREQIAEAQRLSREWIEAHPPGN